MFGKRAEGGHDGVRQGIARLSAAAPLHDLPEHPVVPVAAAAVAHGRADLSRPSPSPQQASYLPNMG